jgi:hypothetical protein
MDWAAFTPPLNRLPRIPLVVDKEAVEKSVQVHTSAIREITDESAATVRTRAESRITLPAINQDEIHLENRLKRQWQITRVRALKPQISRLQRSVTYKLNEWWND